LSVKELAAVLHPASFQWWVAGGYAVEHFVGRPIRSHADIDVLLLRRDAKDLHRLLQGWEIWASSSGRLHPWQTNAGLAPDVNDIWCRRSGEQVWRFQLMLDGSDGDIWRSRRCPGVNMPIRDLGVISQDNLPFLRIEVQLFYKAKTPRPKDEQDLEACLPLLNVDQKMWLHQAIQLAYGEKSPWLTRF
jgi:hypothetical protein